jgi:glycosyltransferase involved in cell wall biosynthesis
VKIAFVFAGGREARWDAALAGAVPTDFFYGAVEISRSGHEVVCIDAPSPSRSWIASGYDALFGKRTPARMRGEHIVAIGRILRRLEGADVVVAASTAHANALAAWKQRGFIRGRLIGIHCGQVNHVLSPARRQATARAMACQEVVLFADAEKAETMRQFAVPDEKLHANAFGVDARFWAPASANREFVLSVGNDGRRDYATLVSAVDGLGVPVKIVTSRPLPQPLPRNVEHLRGSWHAPAVTDEELRELYRRAIAVVVPLEDSIQPSGQSVALQAMACGRPVILSRTRGLWTGQDFAAERDLLLVEPGRPEDLRNAIRRLLDDSDFRERMGRAAREAVDRAGTIDAFAARLMHLIAGEPRQIRNT